MATAAKISKKSCKVLDSWFTDPELKGIFQRSHPKNSETSLYCLVCKKSVTIEHQGKLDLTRHCRGNPTQLHKFQKSSRAYHSSL